MKVLIDTCIVIDALADRVPFNKEAKMLFRLAAALKFDGFISAKSVADIYYIVHQSTHNDKDTRKIISNLFSIFEIADTYGIDCKNAISSNTKDYEDAIMIETALREKVDCIITRNIKDYSNCSMTVYSPKEFLKTYNKDF